MNKLLFKIFTGISLFLFVLSSCSRQSDNDVQVFNLKKIADRHSENVFITNSKIFEKKPYIYLPKMDIMELLYGKRGINRTGQRLIILSLKFMTEKNSVG